MNKRITVTSISEPSKDVIWLKPLSDGSFIPFFFSARGWTPVGTGLSPGQPGELKFQYILDIPDIIIL